MMSRSFPQDNHPNPSCTRVQATDLLLHLGRRRGGQAVGSERPRADAKVHGYPAYVNHGGERERK